MRLWPLSLHRIIFLSFCVNSFPSLFPTSHSPRLPIAAVHVVVAHGFELALPPPALELDKASPVRILPSAPYTPPYTFSPKSNTHQINPFHTSISSHAPTSTPKNTHSYTRLHFSLIFSLSTSTHKLIQNNNQNRIPSSHHTTSNFQQAYQHLTSRSQDPNPFLHKLKQSKMKPQKLCYPHPPKTREHHLSRPNTPITNPGRAEDTSLGQFHFAGSIGLCSCQKASHCV